MVSTAQHKGKGIEHTPWPPVERALPFARVGPDPLHEAMHVKDVRALAPNCSVLRVSAFAVDEGSTGELLREEETD